LCIFVQESNCSIHIFAVAGPTIELDAGTACKKQAFVGDGPVLARPVDFQEGIDDLGPLVPAGLWIAGNAL
jgi:hypothetical protein